MRGDLDASGIPKLFVTGINAHTPDTRVVLDTPYDAEIDTSNPFIFMPRELAGTYQKLSSRNRVLANVGFRGTFSKTPEEPL